MQKLTSRDILFAAINGLIFGALLPVVLKNMNIAISANKGFVIAIAFTLLAAVGVYIGYLLSKYIKVFFQIAKFGAVGAANFAVDIGILNLLIFITGIAAGFLYYFQNNFFHFRGHQQLHLEQILGFQKN